MKTILILENDPAVMRLFCLVLRDYDLLEATSAEEALQQFLEHDRHIDLLIADVILPVASGIHIALLLREVSSELGIVLTSDYPRSMWNDQDAADLGRLGSRSVFILHKPFLSATTLLEIVYGLLAPQPSCATVTALSQSSSTLRPKDQESTNANLLPSATYPKAAGNDPIENPLPETIGESRGWKPSPVGTPIWFSACHGEHPNLSDVFKTFGFSCRQPSTKYPPDDNCSPTDVNTSRDPAIWSALKSFFAHQTTRSRR